MIGTLHEIFVKSEPIEEPEESDKQFSAIAAVVPKEEPAFYAKDEFIVKDEAIPEDKAMELAAENDALMVSTDSSEKNESNSQPRVQCDKCGLWYKHKASLKKHKIRHNETGQSYVCKICGKSAANSVALQSHRLFFHLSKHKCDLCEKTFGWAIKLKEHNAAVHKGEPLYKCADCSKPCMTRNILNSHRARYHTEKFEEERKKRLNGLLTGQKLCNKEPSALKFTCNVCGKELSNRYALYEHVYQHKSRIESFPCKLCKNVYKRAKNLKTHMAIHTGEMRYQCEYCEKRFNSYNKRYGHIKKLHFEKYKAQKSAPENSKSSALRKSVQNSKQTELCFECEICGKKYKRIFYLKEHIASCHASEKLFKCVYCMETFTTFGMMYKHQKKFHPEELEKNTSEVKVEEEDTCHAAKQTTTKPAKDADSNLLKVLITKTGTDGETENFVVKAEDCRYNRK